MSNVLDTPRAQSLEELVELLEAVDRWPIGDDGLGRRDFVLDRPGKKLAKGTAVRVPASGVLRAEHTPATRAQIVARGQCQVNGYDHPVGSVTIIPPGQAPALLTFGPEGGIVLEITCDGAANDVQVAPAT